MASLGGLDFPVDLSVRARARVCVCVCVSVCVCVCAALRLLLQVTKHTTFLNIVGALMMRKGDEAGLHMLDNSGQSSLFGEEQVAAYCGGIQEIVDEVRSVDFRTPTAFAIVQPADTTCSSAFLLVVGEESYVLRAPRHIHRAVFPTRVHPSGQIGPQFCVRGDGHQSDGGPCDRTRPRAWCAATLMPTVRQTAVHSA